MQQADGNFAVTYEVVIENTGATDLTNLSVLEDLAAQFGPAFVSAGNLTLVTGPTDPASVIAIDSAWDGSGATQFIDNSGATGTLLAIGDSFTLQFDVIVLSLIHISEPTRRTPISYAVFCLKKKI